jgi:ribosomal subunit interface protein
MSAPVQITFRHMDPSPTLESRIRELAARLAKFSNQITQCQVVIEAPHQHKEQGALFEVRIDVSVPDRHISIWRSHAADPAHENAYVAVRDAFNALKRKLQAYERKRRSHSNRLAS